jgi:hypothetical protein
MLTVTGRVVLLAFAVACGVGVVVLLVQIWAHPDLPTDPAAAAALHKLLDQKWKESKVVRTIRDDMQPPEAKPLAVVHASGGFRREAPLPIEQPPPGEPDDAGWVAPDGWPSPDDLKVDCSAKLTAVDGKVLGQVIGDACVQLPGGDTVCRGPAAIQIVDLEVAAPVGRIAAPTPWAAEFRAEAVIPDPGVRFGVSIYRRGRFGWATDATISADGKIDVGGGVSIRFGRGATGK